MRTVRVQGCLPTLAVLVGVLALGLVAAAFGTVVLAVTAAFALLFAAQRLVRRVAGRASGAGAPPRGEARERPVVEVLPPGWIERESGPVVDAPATLDAGPRRGDPAAPRPGSEGAAGRPEGADERERPPRG